MEYYNSRKISGISFDEIRTRIEAALKTEGFGILTEIDIQATMKKKLDKDYLPHLILGACNPVYADTVLTIDPNISTLLPCNVTIREIANGDIIVSTINPEAAMSSIGNPEIETSAAEIQEKLMRALNTF
ncbi:MAG: DUF302 domain-containing protein [Crocinitomicaceae bacterium]|nr:DUF302 domain-containing protein [Crocinitomicaceae bacterium]